MFKLLIDYPNVTEEKKILTSMAQFDMLQTILDRESILAAQSAVHDIYCDDKILDYIVALVFATRHPEKYGLQESKKYISYGVSPRATLALHKASRAYAFLKNRSFVTPDDVKAVAFPILRHRLILSIDAEAENITADMLIQKILQSVPTP